jgi:hypothetical protein
MTTPTEEAAAIFTRIFEALARQNGKTLSAGTRAGIGRACELLTHAGEELDALLEDLPTPPRRSPGEAAIEPGWDEFERWRAERR